MTRFALAVSLAAAAFAAAGGTLTMATEATFPPYEFLRGQEIAGIDVEICRAVAERLGRDFRAENMDFDSVIPAVISGKADLAAAGITVTEDRRKNVDFSVPYATEGGMFLYRASDPMPTMITAERLRVGTMDASTYDYYLTSHGIDPVRYDSYVDALDDLREGRLDAVFFDSCAVRIEAERSHGAFAASRLETRENFGVAIRRGNVRLKAALDEAIAARRAP